MPPKKDEEEIEAIRETFKEEGSIKGTAEALDTTRKTVRKYTEDLRDDGDDDGLESDVDASPEPEEKVRVVQESGRQSRRPFDYSQQELAEMSEGEFLETFFDEVATSVNDQFVKTMAMQADVRQQLPDEEQMSQRIQSHSSGIGNANDAASVAELYWNVAQRYLRARGIHPQTGMPGYQGGGGRGEWVTTPQEQQQSVESGDWVDTGGQPPGQPQRGPPNQHSQGGHPQQGPQGGHPQQPGMQQMGYMFQQMMQQQQEMMERIVQSQQGSETDKVEEILDRLEERQQDGPFEGVLKEKMEEEMVERMFNDDDGSSEIEDYLGLLQQQMQQLQAQVEDDSNEMDYGNLMGEDSQMGLLMALSSRDDVDANMLTQLAESLGQVSSDPEVRKKEIEKKIREDELDREAEKWETIMDRFEDVVGNMGTILSLGNGDLADIADTSNGRERPENADLERVEPEEEPEPRAQRRAQQAVQQNREQQERAQQDSQQELQDDPREQEEPDADPPHPDEYPDMEAEGEEPEIVKVEDDGDDDESDEE